MSTSSTNPLRAAFTGRGGEFFALLIRNFLLTLSTFGIYNFWARVHLRRYFYMHTTIAGGHFGWHATGKERFIGFLKALLIFGLVIAGNALLVKISMYLVLILPVAIIILIPAVVVARYRYRMSRTSFNQVRMRFTGRPGDLTAVTLKGILLSIATLGIYAAWFSAALRKFVNRHTFIGTSPFTYDGRGGEIFVLHLKGFALTFITFGIYSSWYKADVANYHTNHTLFQDERLKGDVDGANIFILNFFGPWLTLFTLGLWLPWWVVKLEKVMIEGVSLQSVPDTETMRSVSDDGASAFADGLADAMSLLDNIADFLA
ncbi:MAG: DUF898 family protein [Spirochaetes bacterium]|nr:DUF898 family protein [Spirochaetota bacterium]